jgi:hypothetical protein
MLKVEIVFSELLELKIERNIVVGRDVLPIEIGIHVIEDETAEQAVFSIGYEY